jgi:hypothetical protein
MFSEETMPLGHRRKIETAVKNMKSAIDTGSHEHHLPIVEKKVQNVEMKPSLVKMKENKQEEISKLEAKLELALSRQKDMDKFVPMPEQVGPFKNQTCSVCHIWGHRANGNRDRSHCDKEPCSSWTFCWRKEKHKPEVTRTKKDIEKEIRELNFIISDMRTEIEKMDVFEQRTQTSFMHIMKPRLKSLDPVKYSMSTNLLMRDLIILKEFYDSQIPQHDQMYDKIELPKVLESMANVKRKSSFQISKCLNNTEIPSKKMCIDSVKKTTCTITQPTQLDPTLAWQSMMNHHYMYYNPYFYNPMFYNSNPYFMPNLYQAPQQPPLPSTLPPSNPPLPKGPPPPE